MKNKKVAEALRHENLVIRRGRQWPFKPGCLLLSWQQAKERYLESLNRIVYMGDNSAFFCSAFFWRIPRLDFGEKLDRKWQWEPSTFCQKKTHLRIHHFFKAYVWCEEKILYPLMVSNLCSFSVSKKPCCTKDLVQSSFIHDMIRSSLLVLLGFSKPTESVFKLSDCEGVIGSEQKMTCALFVRKAFSWSQTSRSKMRPKKSPSPDCKLKEAGWGNSKQTNRGENRSFFRSR